MVVALAGDIGPDAGKVHEIGVGALFSICSGPMTLAEAMGNGRELLTTTAEEVVRLVLSPCPAGKRQISP